MLANIKVQSNINMQTFQPKKSVKKNLKGLETKKLPELLLDRILQVIPQVSSPKHQIRVDDFRRKTLKKILRENKKYMNERTVLRNGWKM